MGGIAAYSGQENERADKMFAMEQLAADSGGKAFYNTNNLNAAMMHAIENGAHYYTLVYRRRTRRWMGHTGRSK